MTNPMDECVRLQTRRQLLRRGAQVDPAGVPSWAKPIACSLSRGHSTIVERLVQVVPHLRMSRSYTSRAARAGEVDGVDYNFVSRSTFEAMIARDEFLEWADVFGNYYGTHQSELDRASADGFDLILDIDVKGARQLKERIPGAVSIFILPPSREVLEQRLRSRSQDAEEVIQRRLSEAAEEIRNYSQYDYVLVNHEVQASVDNLVAIVSANRSRRHWMEQQIRPILETFEDGRN